MKSIRLIAAIVLMHLPAVAATSLPDRDQLHVFRCENVLGTSLDLKVLAPSAAEAAKAETAVLDEIDRQAKILSAWDRDSEFSKWVRTINTPVPVSPGLYHVLDLFDQWRTRTSGALDPSAEAVTRVWKTAAAQHRMPTKSELDAAVATVRQAHWNLDASSRTATHLTNTPLALNSFAKSYIADRAADAAFNASAASAVVVNIGGDLVVRGNMTERVEIADPRDDAENGSRLDIINIRDRAVATSGNYRRGVEINGQHYSHIVDPRTGQTAEDIISSTVVARDPSEAGALATAFSVMTPDESRRLAATRNGVEYLLLAKDGRRFESQGWHAMLAAAADDKPGAIWNSQMELMIHIEVANIQEPRVHRPYVAVWIEDAEKKSVRTVALWYAKPRWLPELNAWYHDDQARGGSDVASSVSSATRSAGKYNLKWDGKDDQGKLVKPGKYTVCIEAAREHGTHQLIRQEMDFSGTPKQIDLTGNTELASASLDYRKTSSH